MYINIIYLILSIILCVLICTYITYTFICRKKQYISLLKSELEQNYIQQKQQELDEQFSKQLAQQKFEFLSIQQNYTNQLNQLTNSIELRQQELTNKQEQIHAIESSLQTYEQNLKNKINEKIEEYEATRRALAQQNAEQYGEQLKLDIIKTNESLVQQYKNQITNLSEEAENLKSIIDEYAQKQAAIISAVKRQRELEEQQQFYCVCLDSDSLCDIQLLQSVKRNLKKIEIIDKIIYDSYVAKPVLEMVKRVLNNRAPSGIYKITSIKTGEVYIGKSTDVRARFQQHCKTVFNCGTIASSLLHTKMKEYGIENFTFELIEEVPKDQLAEREKFWIDFYQSKQYGLNEKRG